MVEQFPATRKTQVDKHGRIVIPADLRERLQLLPGEEVWLRVVDGELRIIGLRKAVRRARGSIRRRLEAMGVDLNSRSLVDEFIAERRAESEHE